MSEVIGVIDSRRIHDEKWRVTPELRWLRSKSSKDDDLELQQLHLSDRGDSSWRPVPIVIEK